MKKFINMDFNGSQWWVDYEENGVIFRNHYDSEIDAQTFYLSIIWNYN
jgi:hypothetical protein